MPSRLLLRQASHSRHRWLGRPALPRRHRIRLRGRGVSGMLSPLQHDPEAAARSRPPRRLRLAHPSRELRFRELHAHGHRRPQPRRAPGAHLPLAAAPPPRPLEDRVAAVRSGSKIMSLLWPPDVVCWACGRERIRPRWHCFHTLTGSTLPPRAVCGRPGSGGSMWAKKKAPQTSRGAFPWRRAAGARAATPFVAYRAPLGLARDVGLQFRYRCDTPSVASSDLAGMREQLVDRNPIMLKSRRYSLRIAQITHGVSRACPHT